MDCQAVPHDPKLGTLVAGAGFSVLEAPPLPVNVYAVERNGNLSSSPLFALGAANPGSATVGIFGLGTWPNLQQGSTFQNLIAPADATATTFPSYFLISNSSSLLAGYTKIGTGGSVLLVTPGTGGTPTWLNAPGNYSAASVNSRFVLNSTGLGSITGTAIYALGTGAAAGSTLATFAPAWAAASGLTAATSNGVLIAGYYGTGTTDGKNHLIAVPPSTYLSPLATGSSFPLLGHLEVYAGYDVLSSVGFKDGLAVQRGGFPPPTYDPVTTDIVRFPLTLSGSGVQTVTAGAMQVVISAPNRCTSVDFISHLGDDLLLAVKDRNGRRLVRVTQVAPP